VKSVTLLLQDHNSVSILTVMSENTKLSNSFICFCNFVVPCPTDV
jgi:hypothetical protein